MSTNRYELEAQDVTPVDRTATKLLYVSKSKYGSDWNSTIHTHACTEIFYVIGGVGQFKIEELVYSVSADDLIVINPNVGHTESVLTDPRFEYIVIGIAGVEFSMGGEDGDDRFCVVNCHNGREDILYYLHRMLREIEQRAFGYITICQDLLEILLIQLMRRTDFSLTPTKPGVRVSKGCATARRYIDKHFKENITLDQLAELTHFNKYYLAHSFARQYGVSPINYLIARRIDESRYLLAKTDYSLNQISHILGFSSPSYFSQSFHKAEGISPIEYRKKGSLGGRFV